MMKHDDAFREAHHRRHDVLDQEDRQVGQAAKVVGISKTSILRSIKAGRISAGRDEFGQMGYRAMRVAPGLSGPD
jgi:hypothetical protein